MQDDMGTVQKIYDLHGLELTAKAKQEMRDFIKSHPRGKYGRVRYDLKQQFGVAPESIRERFQFYYDAFPVALEL